MIESYYLTLPMAKEENGLSTQTQGFHSTQLDVRLAP